MQKYAYIKSLGDWNKDRAIILKKIHLGNESLSVNTDLCY